jgi:hypothetical protein
VTFDSVADGLYGLAPERFITERTAAEKQARGGGDRDLATRIHQLTKPTVVGWLANQLVRKHPEEIGPLLELGAGLREATANLSREKLQELARLQHQVIAGLIKQARQIAREADQRVSEDAVRGLEDTLRAALADEELGAQLADGRLTGGLEHVGFAGGFGASSPPVPVAKKSSPPSKKPDELALRRQAKLAEAEAAVSAARTEAQSANKAHKQAKAQLEKTSASAAQLTEKVEKLQAELDEATAEMDAAEHAASDAKDAAERAEHDAEASRQQLDDAVTKRNELTS